jgi:hypothetical protein
MRLRIVGLRPNMSEPAVVSTLGGEHGLDAGSEIIEANLLPPYTVHPRYFTFIF